MKYEDIYIKRYQNKERNFKEEVTVFNSFEIEELLGDERTFEMGEEIALKALKDHYEDNTDITRITIDTDKLDEELKKLQNEIREQAIGVSGDDDAYDYFSDIIYAFYQICDRFGERALYNETADLINEHFEYEENDELFIQHI